MHKKLSAALLMASISTVAFANSNSHSDKVHPHKHVQTYSQTTHTTTCAQTAPMHHSGNYFKSGFFAGLHTGYVYGHGKFNTTYNLNTGAPLGSGSARARSSSVLYGIQGGYDHLLHNGFTLGGELQFTMYGNSKMSTNVVTLINNEDFIFSNSLKKNYSFIPSVKFGKIFWHRYRAYVSLGVGITRFEHEVFNVIEQQNVKINKTRVAFVPSLGMDYALDHHLIVGANLSYELYQNVNNTFNAPELSSQLPGSSYNSKMNPRYFNARVSVNYKF